MVINCLGKENDMKLWQKIFLLTLLLTILAVNTVSVVLLTRNQTNALSLAKDNAQVLCSSVASDLQNEILHAKTILRKNILTERELADCLTTAAADLENEQYQIFVSQIEAGYGSLASVPEKDRFASTMLVHSSEGTQIQAETTTFWEGHFFRVLIRYPVSQLFTQFYKDLLFCQYYSGVISFVVAVILLIVIRAVTRPLNRLEIAAKNIAGGNYQNRIPIKGSDEIAELSKQMNMMSAAIEEKITQIEQISENREIFIANMAHELKTPLTSILGFADLLKIKSEVPEDERREFASIIAAEAKRLRLLSTKLMELVSLGEDALKLTPTPLKALLEKIIDEFAPISDEKYCMVEYELENVTINADPALFTSLILNLMDNARKASELGQVISIRLQRKEGKAIILIRDYGRGIPAEHLAHVTEAFYMVDKARSRGAGGAGVGLSLCKAITEAHHGTFEIDSQEHVGTTVTLTFPIIEGVL